MISNNSAEFQTLSEKFSERRSHSSLFGTGRVWMEHTTYQHSIIMQNYSYRLSVIHHKMAHNDNFNIFSSNRTSKFMFPVLNRTYFFRILNTTHHVSMTYLQFYMIFIKKSSSNTLIIVIFII